MATAQEEGLRAENLILRRQMRITRYGKGQQVGFKKEMGRLDAKWLGKIQHVLSTMTPRDEKAFQQNKKTVRAVQLRTLLDKWAVDYRKTLRQSMSGSYEGAYGAEYKALGVVSKKEKLAKPPRLVLGTTVPSMAGTANLKFKKYVEETLKSSMADGHKNNKKSTDPYRALAGSPELLYRDGAVHLRNNAATTAIMTSVLSGASTARQVALMEAGTTKWKWVATLDDNTCLTCATRDGEAYTEDEMPDQPAHHNCRCVYVRDFDYGDKLRRGFDKSMPDDTRLMRDKAKAGKVGTVPGKTSYSKWFANTPAGFQKEWLGPTRYDLYSKGKLKLDKFVDPRGRIYTIDDLQRLEPEAFKRAA